MTKWYSLACSHCKVPNCTKAQFMQLEDRWQYAALLASVEKGLQGVLQVNVNPIANKSKALHMKENPPPIEVM